MLACKVKWSPPALVTSWTGSWRGAAAFGNASLNTTYCFTSPDGGASYMHKGVIVFGPSVTWSSWDSTNMAREK